MVYIYSFLGDCKLPSRPVMERCIDENLAGMHKKYYRSQRHTIQVRMIHTSDLRNDYLADLTTAMIRTP